MSNKYALAYKRLCDLRVQAMMFDMDIDIETWSLVPKVEHSDPVWLQRYKDKLDESDVDQWTWDMELA